MTDPLAATSFRSWLTGLLRVLRRSGPALVVIQVLVVVPRWLLEALFEAVGAFDLAETGPTSVISVGVIVAPLVAGVLTLLGLAASVFIIVRDAAERPRPVSDVVAFLGRRIVGLLGWGLVVGVVLVLAAVGVGVVAFLAVMSWAAEGDGVAGLAVAGLVVAGTVLAYLATVIVAPFPGVVVIEGRGLRRMLALAHSRFLAVLGRTAVVAVVALGAYALGGVLGGLPFDGPALAFPGEPLWWASQVLASLPVIPAAVFGIAAAVVLYGELRGAGARAYFLR